MDIVLTVQVPSEIYEPLLQMATAAHQTPEQWIITNLRRQLKNPMLDPQLRRYFGSANLGTPTGVDNQTIDEELAHQYNATHEDT
ncbi:MAG: hypothetical protein U0350_08040 [Caldilineaceae bacterium]